jgi:hypothetical protein
MVVRGLLILIFMVGRSRTAEESVSIDATTLFAYAMSVILERLIQASSLLNQ